METTKSALNKLKSEPNCNLNKPFSNKLLDIKASQTKGEIETKSYGNKKCLEQNVVINI
jgi:hypothetical protein